MTAYDIVDFEDRSDWLTKRAAGIGASEMATVMGRSKWGSPLSLYYEKTGEVPAKELDAERIRWGNLLEPIIIQEFGDRAEREVKPAGQLLRSREHPWAVCTPDAWQSLDGATWAVGPQVKTASEYRAQDWVDGAPEPYLIQCHHEMLVTGDSWTSIACLLGGQELVWADIERDEQLIRAIIHCGSRFWQRVKDRDPPPADGSEATRRALARRFADCDGTCRELSPELEEVAQELLATKAAGRKYEKQHKARVGHLENQLKLALGPAEAGRFPGGTQVTWRTVEREGYTVKATKYRQLRVKAPK
jgi:putative phage-type endonuclease